MNLKPPSAFWLFATVLLLVLLAQPGQAIDWSAVAWTASPCSTVGRSVGVDTCADGSPAVLCAEGGSLLVTWCKDGIVDVLAAGGLAGTADALRSSGAVHDAVSISGGFVNFDSDEDGVIDSRLGSAGEFEQMSPSADGLRGWATPVNGTNCADPDPGKLSLCGINDGLFYKRDDGGATEALDATNADAGAVLRYVPDGTSCTALATTLKYNACVDAADYPGAADTTCADSTGARICVFK